MGLGLGAGALPEGTGTGVALFPVGTGTGVARPGPPVGVDVGAGPLPDGTGTGVALFPGGTGTGVALFPDGTGTGVALPLPVGDADGAAAGECDACPPVAAFAAPEQPVRASPAATPSAAPIAASGVLLLLIRTRALLT